jgi:glycosyltransferase involved in cell wall biosynthesis
LRIGVILPHTYLFGGVRRYVELSAAFTSRGHEFIICTSDGESPSWTRMKGECRKFSDAKSADHDVMITGSPEYLEILRELPARLRVFYLQIENVKRESEIVRADDIHVMANSKGLMARILKKYGVRALDGRGGINPALFHPVPVDRGAGGGPFRVMCYGRLSRPRKGTRFVLKAAESMYRSGYDIELLLFDSITPGSHDPRTGFDPGLPFRFYIDLPQERMAAMYASADVFVSAEHRAGWSNTCAEAAACGLPLVCTVSGTTDFAIDGRSALVVGRRDSAPIRKALGRLYRDRDMAERMGLAGAEGILDFTWDKVCDTMSEQFAALLKDGGRTPR